LASLYLFGVLHGRRGDDRMKKIERKRKKGDKKRNKSEIWRVRRYIEKGGR
jgi:hypothetical protein